MNVVELNPEYNGLVREILSMDSELRKQILDYIEANEPVLEPDPCPCCGVVFHK